MTFSVKLAAFREKRADMQNSAKSLIFRELESIYFHI